jgi:dynein heavy chain
MDKAIVTNEEIARIRESYKSVAVRGSILYFVVADMARINDMYQNSLQFVKMLFNKAIDMSTPSNIEEERLKNLIDTISRIIYTNICRGLFERDKLIFSFLIATSIDRYTEFIHSSGWSIVLRGAMPFTEE